MESLLPHFLKPKYSENKISFFSKTCGRPCKYNNNHSLCCVHDGSECEACLIHTDSSHNLRKGTQASGAVSIFNSSQFRVFLSSSHQSAASPPAAVLPLAEAPGPPAALQEATFAWRSPRNPLRSEASPVHFLTFPNPPTGLFPDIQKGTGAKEKTKLLLFPARLLPRRGHSPFSAIVLTDLCFYFYKLDL